VTDTFREQQAELSAAKPGAETAQHRAGEPETAQIAAGPVVTEAVSLWLDGFGRVATRAAQSLLIAGITALAIWIMIRLKLVVVPVLIAILIAAAVSPLVRLLVQRGVPRMLATWAAMLTGLAAVGVLIWFVVNAIRSEWDGLRERANEGLAELQAFLTDGPLSLEEAQLQQARDAIGEFLAGDQVRTGAISGATAAGEAIAGVFLALVVLFFLLKDGRRIWEFFLRAIPPDRQGVLDRVGERSVGVLGGYVRGTAIIAVVDAFFIGLALVILGVPLALPLAVIVFLGAFIPLAGATIAGALAALVALVANGPIVALIVVAVVIAVNQIEGDVLAPIVLGRALSLHPLAILLALTAGAIVAGIIGALLAVPMAAVAWTAITTWRSEIRRLRLAAEAPVESD
jgi:putative heme transporter